MAKEARVKLLDQETTMRINHALDRSIKHWEDMIAWVEKQPKEDKASMFAMGRGINQDWSADDCALCLLSDELALICEDGCPLAIVFGRCNHRQPNNAWGSVASSDNWEKWLVNAKQMLEQLLKAKSEWLTSRGYNEYQRNA